MAEFIAFSPKVEVVGQSVLVILAGMGPFRQMGLELLAKHGIKDPKPDTWYPQQSWLSAFKEIATKLGPRTLYLIGTKVPDHSTLPPGIDTVEKCLSSMDVAYHMTHRGGDIGHYHFESKGPSAGCVTAATPYSCELERGIVASFTERFAARRGMVEVRHDDSKGCRKKGDTACTYQVSW